LPIPTLVKKTLLLCTLFLCFNGLAQDLKALWSDFREGSSSARVKACDELSRYYRSEAHDSLKIIGEELFLYGIDQHYYPAIELGKLTLSDYFILSGKTADGIAMAKGLLANMEERGDDRMLCAACRIISSGYMVQKDSKSAYHWAFKATSYGADNPDPIIKAEALSVLAEAYLLKNQPEKAIEVYQEYITAIKPYNKYRSLSSAYARLGDIYRIGGNLNLAGKCFRYSMNYAKKSKRTTPLAHALNNLGIVYFERGDTAKARSYFEKALQLRLKAQDAKSISESYYNLGDYNFYISKNDLAAGWYKRSLEVARKNNLKNEQVDALRAMAMVAKSGGDFKGATEFLEQFVSLQEEIIVQNSSDDEEVSGLQQTIIRLEAENTIREEEMKNRKGFFASFKWEWVVMLLLLLLVAYLVLSRKSIAPKP
jgi:tetratricopeptide (TPR) repeat protein